MFFNEESGQVSAELILLVAGMIVVVLLATTVYRDYLFDFGNEIKNNEVNDLNNKIDEINNLLKE